MAIVNMPKLSPRKVYCFVDKTTRKKSLSAYKREMNKHYPHEFIIELIDAKKIQWEFKTRSDGRTRAYLNRDYIQKKADHVYRNHKNDIDMLHFFVEERHQKHGKQRLFGFKMGGRYNGYGCALTRLRKEYHHTAEHEDLHDIDDYSKYYAGVRMELLFGVSDFDKYVVHNPNYWKKGYYYDEVWDKMAPVLSFAIAKRRRDIRVYTVTSIKQTLKEAVQEPRHIAEPWRPKNFSLKELVSKKCYNKYEERAWQFLDIRMVQNLQAVRDHYGVPVYCNNWHRGGRFSYRGFDEGGFREHGYSQHNHGRAIDFTVKGITSEQVRQDIIDGKIELPHPDVWLEDDVAWVHMDIRDSDKKGVYVFQP